LAIAPQPPPLVRFERPGGERDEWGDAGRAASDRTNVGGVVEFAVFVSFRHVPS